MTTFRKGDTVQIVSRDSDNATGSGDWDKPNGDVGKVGRITSVKSRVRRPFQVEDSSEYLGYFTLHELRKIRNLENRDAEQEVKASTKGGLMSQLQSVPSTLKRFLNNNYRKFYKLGWIDGELALTEKGKAELLELLVAEYEESLGKVADERIKEIKKEDTE